MAILTLDLGKFKSVACLYEPGSQSAQFETLNTSPAELQDLIQRCSPQRVIIEACSLYGWIHDLCFQLGFPLTVVSTTEEAWRWQNVKRKTDRDDALKLARLTMMGEITPVHVPLKENREYRRLVKYRKTIVGRINRVKNNIRAILDQQGHRAPNGHRAWTEEGIKFLGQYRKPFEECEMEELWKGEMDLELKSLEQMETQLLEVERKLNQLAKQDERVRLLETMPGMGSRTAEMIATVLDDPSRFSSGRAVSAYAGLVPRQHQSGTIDRQGRITKRGPRELRAALVEVAWVMMRYNPWAAEVYTRLCRGQKTRKKQALVALARKILVRCWAMLRDGKPWDPEAGKEKKSDQS